MLVYMCLGYYSIVCVYVFFFFKQKTAYEMRISDWSSDCALPILVCWLSVKSRSRCTSALKLSLPMIGVSNASSRSRYIASIFDWKPRRRRLSPNSSPAPSGVSKVPVWSITDTRSAGRHGHDDATRLRTQSHSTSPSHRPHATGHRSGEEKGGQS